MAHLGNVIRCDVAEWISQLLDVRVEPDGLVDASKGGMAADLARKGYSGIHPDWKIRKNLKNRKVIADAIGSLDYSQHWYSLLSSG